MGGGFGLGWTLPTLDAVTRLKISVKKCNKDSRSTLEYTTPPYISPAVKDMQGGVVCLKPVS